MADRVPLELAILNLVLNANDAMVRGGDVTIAMRNLPAAGKLLIEIRDTGEGMREAVRASAFEPFYTTLERLNEMGIQVVTKPFVLDSLAAALQRATTGAVKESVELR